VDVDYGAEVSGKADSIFRMEKDGNATNFKDADWDLLSSLHIFLNDRLLEQTDCIPLSSRRP
jgi:hypothetical protein